MAEKKGRQGRDHQAARKVTGAALKGRKRRGPDQLFRRELLCQNGQNQTEQKFADYSLDDIHQNRNQHILLLQIRSGIMRIC